MAVAGGCAMRGIGTAMPRETNRSATLDPLEILLADRIVGPFRVGSFRAIPLPPSVSPLPQDECASIEPTLVIDSSEDNRLSENDLRGAEWR